MPLVETVTILNKSGKVVSTGKQLVNIFKDAKEAYQEKKAELRNEHHARIALKNEQKLVRAREETRSTTSSHRSRGSRSQYPRDPSRPPLTEHNLTNITEGSVASSRRSRSSHHGSQRPRSPGSPSAYQAPYVEAADFTHPGLPRRHTDLPVGSALSRDTLPHTSQIAHVRPLHTQSNPDFHADDNIDMNLAYGKLPPDMQVSHSEEVEKKLELEQNLTKLDQLLLEAQCMHHTATSIISNLQANPEAMAAVALTLAELSNLLTKMSPGILTTLKTTSPAIFALLASPQFLIAGGVALGVTVVMFGGYKIIKKIQENTEVRKEANRMEEALVYDGLEMGSIESWRRGIADIEVQSVATSVDGEFITPEAARRKKEHIRERRKEERDHPRSVRAESIISESVRSETARSERTVRRVTSESTLRSKKESPLRASTVSAVESESGRSHKSHRSSKGKELVVVEKEKKKGPSISAIFKKNKAKLKEKDRVSSLSHRPRIVEI